MPDLSWVKDLATIIQATFATAAIIGAAIFAIFKLQLFRDFAPHLSISHTINHRPIADSYTHIDVTTVLHNSSRVKVELSHGLFRLMEIAPVLDDRELEDRLASRGHIEDNRPFNQWPIIDPFEFEYGSYNLIIEPGQKFQETLEFVISRDITTVAIQSAFYNSSYSEGSKKPESWGITTVYDIVNQ